MTLLFFALSLMVSASAAEIQPRVVVDARMELMGLVRRLSGDPSAPRNPVADAAAIRFSSMSSHPAVLAVAATRLRGAGSGLTAQYAVYLSSPPELTEVYPAPVFFADAFGGREALEKWRNDLSRFAVESGFLNWERETRSEREALADTVRQARGDKDMGAPLARLLGAKTWSDWVVYISPFHAPGSNDSWVLEEKDGLPDVAVCFGPYWENRDVGYSPAAIAASVTPEAIYSMTYVLSEACRTDYTPKRESCRGLSGLMNIDSCVQHYWVTALVAQFLKQVYGLAAAKEYQAILDTEPFSRQVRAAVGEYVRNRGRYRD